MRHLIILLSGMVLCLSDPARADITGAITVIDGDTINVAGTRVRLHGIDAPEHDQTCKTRDGGVWSCGAWVTQEVARRYENRRARCSTRDTDRYGRIVAICTTDGEDIGGRLVAEGLAFAYRRYSMAYDRVDRFAANQGVGLHGYDVQTPEVYRRAQALETRPDGCRIKGNISRDGTRIYHSPGQQHYRRTRIDEARGERWFCTHAEAEAAGWRASRR